MTPRRVLFFSLVAWLALVSIAHAWLNLGYFKPSRRAAGAPEQFKVGFLPVTCHLTCPVTDFINKSLEGDSQFQPVRFNGWAELKEAFLAKYMPATFLLAPMAMKLREDGIPLKIVYLGHRDGTAMMVHKDSAIYRVEDLVGKTIAVPNRYSNQRLLIYKAFQDRNLDISTVKLLDMPPPDMPAALFSRAVDAITSGEPFMGQTELDGYGRILYLTKDVWPEFISCVLAVHEDAIRDHRDEIQRLVDGIAKSGKWLDQTMDHRMQAAQFVAKNYYNQNPRLLTHVLSKPADRVKYTNLTVRRKDFEEIQALAIRAGIMNGTVGFDDYCDPSFIPDEATVTPYSFEDAASKAAAAEAPK